jgi:hypothetical protein
MMDQLRMIVTCILMVIGITFVCVGIGLSAMLLDSVEMQQGDR